MGSYNITDSLTNLPIYPNEKVYLIPLVRNHDSDFTGMGNTHTPIFPFLIEAQYDDYGRFRFIESEEVIGVIEDTIKNNMVEISEVGHYSRESIKINDIFSNVNVLYMNIDQRYLALHRPYEDVYGSEINPYTPKLVEYAAFSKEVIDSLVNSVSFSGIGEEPKSFKEKMDEMMMPKIVYGTSYYDSFYKTISLLSTEYQMLMKGLVGQEEFFDQILDYRTKVFEVESNGGNTEEVSKSAMDFLCKNSHRLTMEPQHTLKNLRSHMHVTGFYEHTGVIDTYRIIYFYLLLQQLSNVNYTFKPSHYDFSVNNVTYVENLNRIIQQFIDNRNID